MNVTNLLIYASKKLNTTQVQSVELNALLANSLRVIIEEVFLQLASSFVIVLSSRISNVFNLYINVLEHLFEGVHEMNIQLVIVDYQQPQRIEGPRYYNILLIDSFESFLDIDVAYYTKDYNYNEYYHIFLMQRDRFLTNTMRQIFYYCWNNNLIHCNVEIQNAQGEFHMYTFFPYGPDVCDSTEPQHINQYVDHQWLRKPYFVDKLRNFYGCPMVGAITLNPPFAYFSNGVNGTLTGLEVTLVEAIARFLNFSLVLKVTQEDEHIQPAIEKGFKMLDERTAHFAFGYYRKRARTSIIYTTTIDHYQTPIIALGTWCIIVVSLVSAMAVTKFVRWQQPQAMTTFSIVAAALGIPVDEVNYSFKSIVIFVPWIWSAFMLRSIYTGLLYHLFSTDMYHTMPTSMHEAINDSYATVVLKFIFNDMQDSAYYSLNNKPQKTIVLQSAEETLPLKYLEEHNDEKIFALVAQDFLYYYMKTTNKINHFYAIPEKVMQQQLCLYLAKHSFLIDQFNELLINLKAMGLLLHLTQDHRYNKQPADFDIDQKSGMMLEQDFYGIYIICGILYALSLIVFLVELLVKQRGMGKLKLFK